MKVANDDILKRLMALFEKRTKSKASPESQMCYFWSTSNPPDVLQNSRSLDAIDSEFEILLSEDEAVIVYDMNLLDASNYIANIVKETIEYDLNSG